MDEPRMKKLPAMSKICRGRRKERQPGAELCAPPVGAHVFPVGVQIRSAAARRKSSSRMSHSTPARVKTSPLALPMSHTLERFSANVMQALRGGA